MNKFSLSTILIAALFLFPAVAQAGNPPNSLDPNGVTTSDTSPKLSWQYSESCPASGSCFLVEVDDSASFDSPNKSTYTNNTYYTPQSLSEGNWYWRVKGKDSSGNWSDWSNANFIISAAAPSPTSSPTGDISSPAPSSATSSNSQFTVSGVPVSINSDQSFSVQVSLSLPQNPNTNFYLKGAFLKSGGSNYFGQTLVSGGWVKNSSSYSSQFSLTTDGSGNWSGNLQVMPDSEDSGYSGSGSYIFKVGRYSASGSGPTWSNETSVTINGAVSPPSPSGSPSSSVPKATTKASTSTSTKITNGSSSTTAGYNSSSSTSKSSGAGSVYSDNLPKIASVAGESTAAALVADEKDSKKINWWLIGGGGLVLILTVGLVVKVVKRRYHTANDFKKQLSKADS